MSSRYDRTGQKIIIACALIIVLGFVVYYNSVNIQFIWDDHILIKDNVYIKSLSNIAQIFKKSISAGGGSEDMTYRPGQILTYMLDYSLWGLNVKGYHLSNILFHILATLTIFWFISILYQDWFLSLFSSLFFLVHPVHTEAVTYISGRADSLALLFMLLCFIFYLKTLKTKKITFYILMLLSYAIALFSRENSLILPILLLLYHYTFRKRIKLGQFLPVLTMAFLYILLRFTVLRSLFAVAPATTTPWQRMPGFFVAIAKYFRIMLLPFNLHMEYGNRLFSLSYPQAILGISLLASLFIYVARQRKTRNLIFFGLLWFFVCLLPSSNLYPLNAYMAEHWLYLPSIGLFLILANAFSYLYKRRHLKALTIGLAIGLLFYYSFLTIRQNNYWKDPIAFFERTLKYAPESSRVYNNFAKAYSDLGENEKAIPLFKKTIELQPNHKQARNNLGLAYYRMGRLVEAVIAYTEAIQIDPDYAQAHNNLGLVFFDLGKIEYAINSYRKAIKIYPDFDKAYNNLAVAYCKIGNNDEAEALFKKAIAINPDYAEANNNLAIFYFNQKKHKLAVEYFGRAKELGFVNPALKEALDSYREDADQQGN